MCGIFAYTGNKKAAPILVDGLKTLEYRGYDSAGVYVADLGRVRAVGAVDNLKKKLSAEKKEGGVYGISHTRWATHGEPTEKNAHPHTDCGGNVWLVHNGIVENYREIKDTLEKRGHRFASETDSEVLAHLIEEHMKKNADLEQAVRISLREIRGTYGLAIAHTREPGKIIAARMGSPIVLGVGDRENFIASDSSPILRHTKSVLYLNDGEIAVITPISYVVATLDSVRVERMPQFIEQDALEVKKGGFSHFMMKEIMEGPEVVRNAIRGRLIPEEGLAKLGGLKEVEGQLRAIKRIIIVGCGTAYYSGLVGEYLIEEYAGIPVEVEIASEFRYRKPVIDEHTALLAISQSGETIDTLSALREAKMKGALTLGIVNVVGSTIARETDAGVYNHAGPEVGVASTKAFISQLSVLVLFALYLGRQRGMDMVVGKSLAEALCALPDKMQKILDAREVIKKISARYQSYENFLYIGRKYSYPIAYEGALKLKEISYVHAEGHGAGEMKHGPIALIDEDFPTIAIAPQDSVFDKMISNIQEIKARKGPVLIVTTEGAAIAEEIADDVVRVPKTIEPLSPILSVIPLQLFAYYFALKRGYNVDRPRNLAKSVTVE